MIQVIKPCHCGHDGGIDVVKDIAFKATCPKCERNVSAFTLEGLAEAWNKEPEQQQAEVKP